MLDHQHGVAGLDQAVEHEQELAHVLEVQAGGGLVEDVEGAAGGGAGELAGELDALGFAAGELGGGLAELEVAEADVLEGAQDAGDVAVCAAKSSAASLTLESSSTSAMFFPLKCTRRVASLKRLPSQTSRVTYTSARKCISTQRSPSPPQLSHRPPFTLKLKRPGE